MTMLFVGVDLGGSNTRAALVEADGTVLASAAGRPVCSAAPRRLGDGLSGLS